MVCLFVSGVFMRAICVQNGEGFSSSFGKRNQMQLVLNPNNKTLNNHPFPPKKNALTSFNEKRTSITVLHSLRAHVCSEHIFYQERERDNKEKDRKKKKRSIDRIERERARYKVVVKRERELNWEREREIPTKCRF